MPRIVQQQNAPTPTVRQTLQLQQYPVQRSYSKTGAWQLLHAGGGRPRGKGQGCNCELLEVRDALCAFYPTDRRIQGKGFARALVLGTIPFGCAAAPAVICQLLALEPLEPPKPYPVPSRVSTALGGDWDFSLTHFTK
ncbi:hypothetical protein LZ554_000032 [Drepanopeziza brunnea f. sp. 'monogermtubi']|nr:hypothetical protein LZ554_000032 [Drepanopeziza brunnea f. sp. 'monogermtubi']